jgi:hypothetical protein
MFGARFGGGAGGGHQGVESATVFPILALIPVRLHTLARPAKRSVIDAPPQWRHSWNRLALVLCLNQPSWLRGMSGLFLSYSRADRALAEQIVRSMRAIGVSAWWDEDMGNVDWQLELAERIHELSGVMVIWTEESQKSVHVRDEARLALQTDKLVNVMHGVSSPPFPFDRINGFHLDDWSGRDPHRGWTRVVAAVEELVVQKGGAKPGEITVAQAMREEKLQGQRKAIAAAQANLQRVQAREAEIGDEKKRADVVVEQAQDQLQRIAEMRASAVLLRAAQQEFDAAFEAREEAAAALQKTRREFERASTALATAMEEFETMVSAPEPLAKVVRPAPRVRAASPAPDPPAPEPAPAPPRKPRAAAPRPARPKPAAPPEPAAAPEPQTAPEPESPLVRAEAAPDPPPPPALAVPTARAPRPHGNRPLIVAGIGIGLALAVGVILLTIHPPAAGAWNTPATAPADPSTDAAAALNGTWAPPHVDCANGVTLKVSGAELTWTVNGQAHTVAIVSAEPGVIKTHGADGDQSYQISGGRLTATGPTGSITSSRCAG